MSDTWELSPREREVACLAARGFSRDYIGTRLVISPRTVDTHITHIYEKLGIHSRNDLIEQYGHWSYFGDSPSLLTKDV